MEFNENETLTKTVKIILDKYLSDITSISNDELFAVFDIVNKKYEETNECPICSNYNQYRYSNVRIGTNGYVFYISNGDIVNLCIPVNYCPICGRKISN